jgi:agmatine/peptidylarginine deiminase
MPRALSRASDSTLDLALPLLVPQPPSDVEGLPGEFEPVEELVVGWSVDAWSHHSAFVKLVSEASLRTRVTVLYSSEEDLVLVPHELGRAGARMDRVSLVYAPLDTMWIRDYGPLVVRTRDGGRRVIDFPYARSNDDKIPALLAARAHTSLSAAPIDLEGGHIQSDGAGRCIVSSDVVYRNQEVGRTEQDVREALADYLGCRTTVVVPYLEGEETGHVDVFLYVTAPGRVLVGRYERSQDRVNRMLLEQTASALASAGFEVTRIPMPSNSRRRAFRSYTNVVVLEDVVFVPVYSVDREHERRALRTYRRAFPGRRIIAVDAERLVRLGGALHCVTITISAERDRDARAATPRGRTRG